MHFPKYLFDGYQKIKTCALVKNKDYSPEALAEFETLLNSAQPTNEHMERFNTVKDFYNMNKFKFQSYIRGTGDMLILWTESKSIVNWFHLRGIVYLSYDHTSNRYKVQRHRNLDTEDVKDGKSEGTSRQDLWLLGFPNMTHHNDAKEAKEAKPAKFDPTDFPGLTVRPAKGISSLKPQTAPKAAAPPADANDDDIIVFDG